ncbi:MAG: radical SAM protein [Deltaproteobacteria bacterium]|nr:radical SAM protein [Deltaproteobacteria bacterium]
MLTALTAFDSIDPRDLPPAALESACKKHGVSPREMRRLLASTLERGEMVPVDWTSRGIISAAKAALFDCSRCLKLAESAVSQIDGFQKLLFYTPDNLPVETVIIPLHKENCVSICLSSQVGCVMGCVFCATAKMAQRRNLRTWEIVEQFIKARQIARSQNKRVTGAVFMGMGEPFLNYDRVIAAAKLLCYPVSGAISAKAITISTVGLVPEIERFTIEKHPFRLSISLGGATDEKRAALVPVAARTPVNEVIKAARRYSESRRDRINLSYVCISGFNVSEQDAVELAALIGDLPVRLDLIDATDSRGQYQPPSESEMKFFRDALSKHLRQPVARRYSGGKDINAACGTLAGKAVASKAAQGEMKTSNNSLSSLIDA